MRRDVFALFVFSQAVRLAMAHSGEHEVSEEEEAEPIDTILYMHMGVQLAVWGILFPIGMVLGLSRSRWHVPVQVCHVWLSREY